MSSSPPRKKRRLGKPNDRGFTPKNGQKIDHPGWMDSLPEKKKTLPDKFFHEWNHPKNDSKISKVGIIPNRNPRGRGLVPWIPTIFSGEKWPPPFAVNKNFGRKIKSALFVCFFVVSLDSFPLKTASKLGIFGRIRPFVVSPSAPKCLLLVQSQHLFFDRSVFFYGSHWMTLWSQETYSWIDWVDVTCWESGADVINYPWFLFDVWKHPVHNQNTWHRMPTWKK